MIGMKEQCFGVEIEMTGITREEAARALADYFGTTPRYYGRTYDAWIVKDPAGKEWKLMSDSSIHPECQSEDGYLRLEKYSKEGKRYKVEMVTPKLTYAELPRLQECMRRVTAIGAKVNDSCGLHVHVDASNHNRQSLKNLISIMYSKAMFDHHRLYAIPLEAPNSQEKNPEQKKKRGKSHGLRKRQTA